METEDIRVPTEHTSGVYAQEQRVKVNGESTNMQTPNGKGSQFRISGRQNRPERGFYEQQTESCRAFREEQ